MTLLNAPAYDERKEHLKKRLLIGTAATVALLVLLTLTGFLLGHGWFFTNLPAEHKVNEFYSALEAKDYAKAYGLYYNDPGWQQHPERHREYPLQRFTDDWTKDSPAGGPILTHHVDISKTDGTGTFGTGIIVAATVTAEGKTAPQQLDIYYIKKTGELTYPSFHVLQY